MSAIELLIELADSQSIHSERKREEKRSIHLILGTFRVDTLSVDVADYSRHAL